ncbi:MAG: hypothetical protein AAFO76_04245 [Cyanobacteria bacterium J06607_15]
MKNNIVADFLYSSTHLVACTLLIGCFSYLNSSPSAASESAESAEIPGAQTGQSGAPNTKELLEARSIRLSIVNSVVDFVGNAKRARLQFDYDLLTGVNNESEIIEEELRFLGLDEEIDPDARGYKCGLEPVTIELSNEVLGKPEEWNLEDDEQKCLMSALAVSDLNNLTNSPSDLEAAPINQALEQDDMDFDNFWFYEGTRSCDGQSFADREGCGFTSLIEREIPISDYIGMQRDRNILKNLLRSQGIAYSIDFDEDADIISPNAEQLPIKSFDDINWTITIREKLLKPQNNSSGSVSYFRISAQAKQKKPITLLFRGSSMPKPKVRLVFRNSAVTTGLERTIGDEIIDDLNFDPVKDSLSSEVTELLTALEAVDANTQLEQGFTSVTGLPASESISRGILGGTATTSIVTGGLFGSGEVQALVGANSEFRSFGDFTPGILLGVAPGGDDSTLFVGPSIRYSIFTLAVGARAFEFDDGVRIREGGTLSIDLSRVTGGKPTSKTIKNSSVGGGWEEVNRIVGNDIADNAFVLYPIVNLPELKPEQEQEVKITLFQKQDAEGNLIAADSPRPSYSLITNNRLFYIPPGVYGLNFELPDGYKLVLRGDIGTSSDAEYCSEDFPALTPAPDAAAKAESEEAAAEEENRCENFPGLYTTKEFAPLKLDVIKE